MYKTLWILGYLLHQLVIAGFLNHQQYLVKKTKTNTFFVWKNQSARSSFLRTLSLKTQPPLKIFRGDVGVTSRNHSRQKHALFQWLAACNFHSESLHWTLNFYINGSGNFCWPYSGKKIAPYISQARKDEAQHIWKTCWVILHSIFGARASHPIPSHHSLDSQFTHGRKMHRQNPPV